jgi:hypothetical protein
MGCELEIIRQGWRIAGVEYPADSVVNQGRLCPRGSASAQLIDDARRLTCPLKDGRESSWPAFFAEVGPRLHNCPSTELGITYDRNLTLEELEQVVGMANQLGTENVASACLDSESCLDLRLDARTRAVAPVSLSDIARADTILIVGDVFAKMPVLAKAVLDARYESRDRRLYCVDCMKTTTAGFAHKFIWTRPGLEPLVLLGLAGLIDSRLAGFECDLVAAKCGVEPGDLREIAAAFDKPKKGLVLGTVTSGRTVDPKLLSLALQLLVSRMKGNKKLLLAGETAVPSGPRGIGDVFAGIESGEIRTLVNLGEGFPEEYPGWTNRLGRLDLLVTTATVRPREALRGWVLPVPMNLEKSGTVNTVWGAARLNAGAAPVSGSRTVPEIIDGLLSVPVSGEAMPSSPARLRVPSKLVTDQGRALLQARDGGSGSPNYPFMLLAERPAYGFRGVFENPAPVLLMARDDAEELGFTDTDRIRVETAAGGKVELGLALTDRLKPGTVLVNDNPANARALFPAGIDRLTGAVAIPPVRARLWRSE